MKKVIINADDFGQTKNVNEAIMISHKEGILSSTSLMANMDGFNNAVYEIYPQIKTIDIGFHFNLTEGKSLSKNKLLCDTNGYFNNGFLSILLKSGDKKFLNAVEEEFRIQIEKTLNEVNISHIDSHRHIHAIPAIFQITKKLAEEYNIKYIRTQREIPYIIPSKILDIKFPANIIKSIILNGFSTINNHSYTNKFFIGILYTGYMDEKSIINGLKSIKEEESITEIIIHPTIDNSIKNNYEEFLAVKNRNLKQQIQDSGFEIIQYSQLY